MSAMQIIDFFPMLSNNAKRDKSTVKTFDHTNAIPLCTIYC